MQGQPLATHALIHIELCHQFRLHDSRTDAVHANLLRRVIERHGFGHGQHRTLGSRVCHTIAPSRTKAWAIALPNQLPHPVMMAALLANRMEEVYATSIMGLFRLRTEIKGQSCPLASCTTFSRENKSESTASTNAALQRK